MPPADVWDVWTVGRTEMQQDPEMRAGKERMITGLEMAMRITAKVATRHTEARVSRGAWIAVRTGQMWWKPALESVIGGVWAGARDGAGRKTDTDMGIERAVKTVQSTAGALLVRWQKWGRKRNGGWREGRRCVNGGK